MPKHIDKERESTIHFALELGNRYYINRQISKKETTSFTN